MFLDANLRARSNGVLSFGKISFFASKIELLGAEGAQLLSSINILRNVFVSPVKLEKVR